jgi:CheY-like chemotaxis protein
MNLGISQEDSTVTILVVDDSTNERDIIVEILCSLYPSAKIIAPINLFHLDVEEFIKKGQYTVILLDSLLSKWEPHEKFGEWGENMIPFIKQVSPKSIIIAIASNEDDNKTMVAKGAKFAINKRRFLDEKFKDSLPTPIPL